MERAYTVYEHVRIIFESGKSIEFKVGVKLDPVDYVVMKYQTVKSLEVMI